MFTPILLSLILAFSHGFILRASLIISIGPRNLFVLQQGLRREHLFATALFCTLPDLLLIAIGVAKSGEIVSANKVLLAVINLGGAIFLFWYGLRAFRTAWFGQATREQKGNSTIPTNLRSTILAALAVSLLNPAAYLNVMVMIGAIGVQYPVDGQISLGLGAAVASALWFFMLTYGSGKLGYLFSQPKAWRALDVTSGCIMFGIAIFICVIQYFSF